MSVQVSAGVGSRCVSAGACWDWVTLSVLVQVPAGNGSRRAESAVLSTVTLGCVFELHSVQLLLVHCVVVP